MTSAVEIIIIIMLCGMCFLIWAECSEVCECCDCSNHEPSLDTNDELQISPATITSPIQSNFVEL